MSDKKADKPDPAEKATRDATLEAVHNPTTNPDDPAKAGHDVDEVKPETKGARDASGAMLPSFPPTPAGEPENTHQTSPAGPGKPIDGSPAVNTYTPRAKQAQEFKAGDQDWQNIVATKGADVELPSAQASAKPNPRTKAAPDGAKPSDQPD